MSEILDGSRSELLALDGGTLAQPKVARERVVALTRVLGAGFAIVEPRLDGELTPARAALRRTQAARLESRALAYFAADLARKENAGGERGRRAELAAVVAEHDRYLLKWAWPLFGEDEILAGVLADIQRGTGFQDDAEDVVRLVELFRDHWPLAQGRTPVTEERLATAESDATEMVTLLSSPEPDGSRDLAWRAYTAWRADYREIMALGRYLMRDADGVQAMFPGITNDRLRAARTDHAEPELEPDAADEDALPTTAAEVDEAAAAGELAIA